MSNIGPNKYTPEFVNKLTQDLVEFMKSKEGIWLKDFAIKNGIPAEYLSRLAKDHPEFAKALQMAKDLQESKLLKGGLSGKFPTAMVIFALKNVAGWRDRQDVTSDDQALKGLTIYCPKEEDNE